MKTPTARGTYVPGETAPKYWLNTSLPHGRDQRPHQRGPLLLPPTLGSHRLRVSMPLQGHLSPQEPQCHLKRCPACDKVWLQASHGPSLLQQRIALFQLLLRSKTCPPSDRSHQLLPP